MRAYDFVQSRTHYGRPLRMLTTVDEHPRECLPIDVARKLRRDGRRVFSKSIYKERNVVERCIGWLKQNRRLSTRYEKLATSDLAMVKLAFISRYLRLLEPSDTA